MKALKFALLTALSLSSAGALAAPSPANQVLNCVGTEPFWNMSIHPQRGVNLRSNVTDDVAQYLGKAEMNSAAGMSTEFLRTYKMKDAAGKTSRAIVIADENCSDGMSDNLYSYEVIFEPSEGGMLYGCCNKRGESRE